MSDAVNADPEREWTWLDRLLVGRDPDLSRVYVRAAVILLVSQVLFSSALYTLRDRIPVRNLVAFGTMLVLMGLVGAVYASYRNGGLLVCAGLVLGPLAGTLPVAMLADVEGLAGQALVVAGFGVWAATVCYLLGEGVRRLRARVGTV